MRHCLLVFLTLFLLLPFAYGGCGGSSPDGNSSDDNGPSAVISGEVFEDTNINGIRDLNEDGMSGVNITASGAGSFLETVTDQLGAYRVRIEEPGTYLVTKTDPPGYLPTNAIPGSDGSKIDNNSMEVVVTDAYVDAEKELPGYDFGINAIPTFWIEGNVWIDTNMDGTPDTGENPLAGATVSLSTGPDQVTGPDGGFMIFSSMTGAVVVTVQVVHPTGYVGTNAIPGIGGTRVTSTIILVDRGAVPFDIGLNAYASSGHWFGAVIP